MNIEVKSRSQNDFLYDRMASFIPGSIQGYAYTGYNSWKDASDFIHDAIDSSGDMLLILDEDTFIVNWEKVMELCVYMKENNYTHAGVPDGGLLAHRTHSYITMNPFFVVFNCSILNPIKKKYSRNAIDAHEFSINMHILKPEWTNDQYQNDSFEPFAGLFYWMAEHGRPLFLNASTMSDGISTKVFGINNTVLCLHAWYSRLYDQDCKERNRIDELYVCATNIAKTCHIS
jgi:hypothetical protein